MYPIFHNLFCLEGDIVGTWMDEFEFEGACQSFVKGIRGFEAGGMGFLCVELGGGAEFLDAD